MLHKGEKNWSKVLKTFFYLLPCILRSTVNIQWISSDSVIHNTFTEGHWSIVLILLLNSRFKLLDIVFLEVKMQYQVSIASLLRKLHENYCKRHNFSPIIQSIYYHDNIYSKRETHLLYFLQKKKWPGMLVWLAIVKKNIQSNEHTADYLYTRVVFQTLHWCKRSLDRRLEADFLILWMKVFEGVLCHYNAKMSS